MRKLEEEGKKKRLTFAELVAGRRPVYDRFMQGAESAADRVEFSEVTCTERTERKRGIHVTE